MIFGGIPSSAIIRHGLTMDGIERGDKVNKANDRWLLKLPCSLKKLNVYCLDQSMDMPEKAELQRKLELLRKIYEEDRLENMKRICEKYRNAGVAAMNELLELTGDPKPSPFEVMRTAGFDPQVLGFDPDT
nr:unnamed protein product [Spirometra erinaceieuropaei]